MATRLIFILNSKVITPVVKRYVRRKFCSIFQQTAPPYHHQQATSKPHPILIPTVPPQQPAAMRAVPVICCATHFTEQIKHIVLSSAHFRHPLQLYINPNGSFKISFKENTNMGSCWTAATVTLHECGVNYRSFLRHTYLLCSKSSAWLQDESITSQSNLPIALSYQVMICLTLGNLVTHVRF